MKLFKRKRIVRKPLNAMYGNDVNQFKRNRTMSYGFNQDESSRHKTHKLVIKRRRAFSVFIVVVLMFALAYLLINNFTAKVIVNFSDNDTTSSIESSEYVDAINSFLDDHPLSRFNFVLNASDLNESVINKLPEVDSIKLKQTIMGETVFEIKMRRAVAGWVINSKQYYVDSSGVPFMKNYFSNSAVQIVDNSGVEMSSDDIGAIVSKRFLSFVGQIVSLAKNSGYTVTQAILPSGTTRELDINLKEVSAMVKLTIDRSEAEQIEDMANALKYFSSKGTMPSYIDVRVSGKAFYK